jgi:type III restriction enzyme
VKRTDSEIWVIETKGREDLDDPTKWERLQQWCADATAHDGQRMFKPLFVRQEDFEKYQPQDFAGLVAVST